MTKTVHTPTSFNMFPQQSAIGGEGATAVEHNHMFGGVNKLTPTDPAASSKMRFAYVNRRRSTQFNFDDDAPPMPVVNIEHLSATSPKRPSTSGPLPTTPEFELTPKEESNPRQSPSTTEPAISLHTSKNSSMVRPARRSTSAAIHAEQGARRPSFMYGVEMETAPARRVSLHPSTHGSGQLNFGQDFVEPGTESGQTLRSAYIRSKRRGSSEPSFLDGASASSSTTTVTPRCDSTEPVFPSNHALANHRSEGSLLERRSFGNNSTSNVDLTESNSRYQRQNSLPLLRDYRSSSAHSLQEGEADNHSPNDRDTSGGEAQKPRAVRRRSTTVLSAPAFAEQQEGSIYSNYSSAASLGTSTTHVYDSPRRHVHGGKNNNSSSNLSVESVCVGLPGRRSSNSSSCSVDGNTEDSGNVSTIYPPQETQPAQETEPAVNMIQNGAINNAALVHGSLGLLPGERLVHTVGKCEMKVGLGDNMVKGKGTLFITDRRGVYINVEGKLDLDYQTTVRTLTLSLSELPTKLGHEKPLWMRMRRGKTITGSFPYKGESIRYHMSYSTSSVQSA